MKTIGVRALKQNASSVVAEAAGGDLITITARGKAVALLGPIPTSRLAALLAAGAARPPRRGFSSLGTPARRAPDELSLSATLAGMRGEERY